MLDIKTLKNREEPIKYTKIEKTENTSNVVNSEKNKAYDYYICDYCGDAIRLDIKRTERSGGTVIFPHSLTKCGDMKLALCNKCLKKAIKEFEK